MALLCWRATGGESELGDLMPLGRAEGCWRSGGGPLKSDAVALVQVAYRLQRKGQDTRGNSRTERRFAFHWLSPARAPLPLIVITPRARPKKCRSSKLPSFWHVFRRRRRAFHSLAARDVFPRLAEMQS